MCSCSTTFIGHTAPTELYLTYHDLPYVPSALQQLCPGTVAGPDSIAAKIYSSAHWHHHCAMHDRHSLACTHHLSAFLMPMSSLLSSMNTHWMLGSQVLHQGADLMLPHIWHEPDCNPHVELSVCCRGRVCLQPDISSGSKCQHPG